MPAELGVGVIGFGVGAQHVAAYRAHPACRVVAVCDRAPDRLAEALANGDCAATTDAAELIARSDVDIVSIASFDDDHFEQARLCLEAGKHVFVEKPLCRTTEELRALKEAWTRAGGRLLASNLVLRAAPLYRWLHAAVRKGELGRLYAIDGDYLYGRLEKITNGWRSGVAEYSVMLGGGIHLVDLMLWIAGERPIRVAAAGNSLSTEGSAFRYADYVSATFECPSRLIGRVTANFGCVHRHQHVLRVFGTDATFVHDDHGPRLHTSRDPAAHPEPVDLSSLPATKGDLIPEFVDAVLAGEDGGAAQREFDLVAACVAADRSLRERIPVEVEYV